MRLRRTILAVIALALAAFHDNRVLSQGGLTIGNYELISDVRINRTTSQLVYRAVLTNSGGAIAGATAVATSLSAATTIVEGTLTFGAIAAGGTGTSIDTIAVNHDRTVPFSFANLQWAFTPIQGNRAPTADAGTDQAINGAGLAVQLNGSGSFDPDSDPLTYRWTLSVPSGSAATLSSATAERPTFVLDRKGAYVATLIVADPIASSLPDTTTITVANTPPTANAGADQTTTPAATVTLDGTGSTDVDGDALTYSWTLQDRPATSAATLTNQSAPNPSFVVDAAGTYRIRLVVSDGTSSSSPDTVVISTTNSAPTANAGPDQTGAVGATVTLNGSGSSDVDGDSLSFGWTLVDRPAGSTAVLSSASAVAPTFVIDRPGLYRARLIVNDGQMNSAADFIEVTTVNSAPVANAGPDQAATVGSTVTLNGSGSTDVDGDTLTYAWALTRPTGSQAVLSSAGAITPTFVVDLPGSYVAQLIVNDGKINSAADTVTITTSDPRPLADAGPDQSFVVGQTVFLDGTRSSDPAGQTLSYLWSFVSKPNGSSSVLGGATTQAPTFVSDRVGTYVVQLVVSNGTLTSAPDTVTISTSNILPIANAGPDQLGVAIGATISLSGLASTDANNHPLTYSWSLITRPAGSSAVLSGETSALPTFVADRPGDFVAQLIVHDGFGNSDVPDTVLIRTVANVAPTAHAGIDRTVTVGTTLTLDASGSSDPEQLPLTFQWTLRTASPGSTAVLAGASTAAPTLTPDQIGTYVIDLTVTDSAGSTATASVTITAVASTLPSVSVLASDAAAAESGADVGMFSFTRTGSTTSSLTVSYAVNGTASAGDYTPGLAGSITIPAGQATATVTIVPTDDAVVEGDETVVVTLSASSLYTVSGTGTATVTIADNDGSAPQGGTLVNGFNHSGTIAVPQQLDSWTLTAVAGDVISLSIGKVTDTNGAFWPWIRLQRPDGSEVAQSFDPDVSQIDTTIAAPGTYTVVVGSKTSSSNTSGTGSYVLTLAQTPGNFVVPPDDEGGALINGANHQGTIHPGDLDQWTFEAAAGDAIALSIGEVADTNGAFWPWIRLRGPDGAQIASSFDPVTAQIDTVALASGRYTVIVGTDIGQGGSVFRGTGTYQLTLAQTPGNIVVPSGDEGGPLTNGANHHGTIHLGDLDQWTFDATAGDAIALSIGEVTDTNGAFWPWIRLRAPDGTEIGSSLDAVAAQIDTVVAASGRYTVIVGTNVGQGGSLHRGTGTYQLTLAQTPGAFVVSPGDEGGELVSGVLHAGAIHLGDLDLWTFRAEAGQPIALSITKTSDVNGAFAPWLRLRRPDGSLLASDFGANGAALNAVAPVSGAYVLVVGTTASSGGSRARGVGTYALTGVIGPTLVTIAATDAAASETGPDAGAFTITRTGLTTAALQVSYTVAGTASATDYAPALSGTVTIPAGQASATVTITPVNDSIFEGDKTVVLTLTDTAGYDLGAQVIATVTIADDDVPQVTVTASDAAAAEVGADIGTFTVTRTGTTSSPLTVLYSVAGSASNGVDYTPVLGGTVVVPVGQASTTFSVTPIDDAGIEGDETVTITLTPSASYSVGLAGTATVTIADNTSPTVGGGTLVNGFNHTGTIAVENEIDSWTFNALAGDAVSLSIGKVTDFNGSFSPWIRLRAPDGTILSGSFDGLVAQIHRTVQTAGLYTVLVGSTTAGDDRRGTGVYQLTLAQTPGAFVVPAGDEGGALTNGANHLGTIHLGDLDQWTFDATAGDAISLSVGEIADTNGEFSPWIRLRAPNGTLVAESFDALVAQLHVTASVGGKYTVVIGSLCCTILPSTAGSARGVGTYRLTLAQTPKPFVVPDGDEGGVLTNGHNHVGTIQPGDLDQWTFDANAGDAISLSVGEVADTNGEFSPWIRLRAPNGTLVAESFDALVAQLHVTTSVSGKYTVVIGSLCCTILPSTAGSARGAGTYRLTLAQTPEPFVVPTGDEGGVLTNGDNALGTIHAGDLDKFTFTAAAGDAIALSIGEVADTNGEFSPWIRLHGPDGTLVAQTFDALVAQINVTATTGGTYYVVVGSLCCTILPSTTGSARGVGTYRLTLAQTPAAFVVPAGDEGGPLSAVNPGTIHGGDLDQWTFAANAGDSIVLRMRRIIDVNGSFSPWMRLRGPNGVVIAESFDSLLAQIDATAPVAGLYTVVAGSFSLGSGPRGIGSYEITRTVPASPITITATDATAAESGPDSAVFTVARSDAPTTARDVTIVVSGSATPLIDFIVSSPALVSNSGATFIVRIPAGQSSVTVTVIPVADVTVEGPETVVLTAEGSSASATIADGAADGGPLINGYQHTGTISSAGEVDTWTFDATAGDRIGVHLGEIVDVNGFVPWVRMLSPSGAVLGNDWNVAAAYAENTANVTGTYRVLIASNDTGRDGTGTYRLTMTHTPGPVSVADGDEGGPLTNGTTHSGVIVTGDLDVWTFTATAGDRIGIHIGETSETSDFRPWIRLWTPNGVVVGNNWDTGAAYIEAGANVTGTYVVLVASNDVGNDGTGTYRLTMTHTPGPVTISSGDEGGALTNGTTHTGEITQGDLDVWTFTATAGDRIGIHIGETSDTSDFRPWIRLWTPNGLVLGNNWDTDAAYIEAGANVTGTYVVLVASNDVGNDGTGTYRLTMTHTPGPVTISSGDEGGALTNGATHTGEITQGDLDVWTFTATAGDRIGIHIGETSETSDFRPWIRLWTPNGVVVGNNWDTGAAYIEAGANVTGTYVVLVASNDVGNDGTGTYRLTITHTPGPVTISSGDEGGALTNGATHTGEITQGDLDVWTFTATAGERIGIHVGETTDTGDFRPWIRLWAPNGVVLANNWDTDAAYIDAAANVTGTYVVLVASNDVGNDGTGTYRLTMTHTPGPVTISVGDDGGALTNGATHTGAITQGDLDVWTLTAVAGQRISVQISQTAETDDFRPWIRLWSPTGVVVASVFGVDSAQVTNLSAPTTGTYLVLVASADSGNDGVGSYSLTTTVVNPP